MGEVRTVSSREEIEQAVLDKVRYIRMTHSLECGLNIVHPCMVEIPPHCLLRLIDGDIHAGHCHRLEPFNLIEPIHPDHLYHLMPEDLAEDMDCKVCTFVTWCNYLKSIGEQ